MPSQPPSGPKGPECDTTSGKTAPNKAASKPEKKITAHWTEEEEKILIDFLATDGKAAAADGANYRKPVWEAAARKLGALPCKGAPKTWQVCKNKWGRLKKAYWAIVVLENYGSGLTYNEEKGAGITEDMEEIWAAYIKSHPDASPFKNRGFVHYPSMQPLMPTKAKGSNVFRAGHVQPSQAAEDQGDENEAMNDDETQPADEDEEEDDEDDDVVILPTTPASSQKRKSAVPHGASTKKARVSQGAQALQAVGEKLDDFNTILRSLVALESQEPASSGPIPPATPQRKQLAIRRAQHLEDHLDDDRLVALINIFEKDGSSADTYLVLERESLRRAWVENKLASNM
ncbi:hypothetical protein BN946_scf184884.g73 [Trametes cinnabarina]|uniref:Myb-like domain-containing protein n=1 Tax=Pycnoporus cinnabarinus TaxID=5643 RepID=A0A060SCB0_PYCCI|nr:hypothetical protein BN946_scf184884.g73 [Trametes cinnabarina]